MLLFGILIMTWPWYQFVFKRFSFFDAKKNSLYYTRNIYCIQY